MSNRDVGCKIIFEEVEAYKLTKQVEVIPINPLLARLDLKHYLQVSVYTSIYIPIFHFA